jgi:cytidine deaminase
MIFLHEAVYSVYPNAAVIRGNDIDSITAEDVNGEFITVDKNKVAEKFAILQAAKAQAEQAAKDAKASALAKLTALGLTQAEVTALIG